MNNSMNTTDQQTIIDRLQVELDDLRKKHEALNNKHSRLQRENNSLSEEVDMLQEDIAQSINREDITSWWRTFKHNALLDQADKHSLETKTRREFLDEYLPKMSVIEEFIGYV